MNWADIGLIAVWAINLMLGIFLMQRELNNE